ncbi:MFS transporter [Roseococcus sp. SDR]|uniref:MFS transporter n=1 Tax=Roseococcus sp. SDR TaxID=2835532 RepID=UPI001BCA903C|nr:MFS transporter [Roseococcus sp. SDR]MBS7790807.1 MFS transporter [Roseococcus sp. SDR]MBV1846121.1 MFS transporter [Roseococcus sp. SDR]
MRGFAVAVITAQVLTQIGAFTLPALLPEYLRRWNLSATEAGWLIGAFFAAYVVVVPVLVSLTDRLPARRIYLLGTGLTAASHLGFAFIADGFWSGLVLRAMAGMGWAGCYMPGLKVIAERLEGNAQSRAVSWHAAGVGIAGAISFAVAGFWAALGGAEAAFLFSGVAACVACTIGAIVMPRVAPRPPAVPRRLLDFRPVLRNRAATGWIIGYTVHTWELAALRAWAVTFLTLVIARAGAPDWLPGPTALFTAAGLAGIAISVTGNETAQRFGRARVVAWAMAAGALMSVLTGLSAWVSAPLAALAVLLWNVAIYLDSSALTAGTVQAAGPELRGATMGLHSMCGYAGGFVGPVGVGLALDLLGPANPAAWALAFGHLALVTLAGLFLLRRVSAARG